MEQKTGADEASAYAEVWGGQFIATSLSDNGTPLCIVAGSQIELTFSDRAESKLNFKAGCNSMFAAIEELSPILVLGEIGSTRMLCADDLMDQENWVSNVLSSRPTLELSGQTLTLSSTGIVSQVITLQRVDAA